MSLFLRANLFGLRFSAYGPRSEKAEGFIYPVLRGFSGAVVFLKGLLCAKLCLCLVVLFLVLAREL